VHCTGYKKVNSVKTISNSDKIAIKAHLQVHRMQWLTWLRLLEWTCSALIRRAQAPATCFVSSDWTQALTCFALDRWTQALRWKTYKRTQARWLSSLLVDLFVGPSLKHAYSPSLEEFIPHTYTLHFDTQT